MSTTENDATILEERLRLGIGLQESDRPRVLSALGSLDRHLEHWKTEQVDVHIAIKERDRREQIVTLEVWLPHVTPLVVHVSDPDLDRALVEARKMMAREIEECRNSRS